MPGPDEKHDGAPLEIESTERWAQGKNDEELLVDLKAYLARLRDNPRSLPDRLRVATIQHRLGRTQEALIHYEGVIRGYMHENRALGAIALCRRVIALYPEVPRLQRLLAALYAHAPHGATGAPSPVTPISSLEDQPTASFVVEDSEEEEDRTDRNVVVDRVFPEVVARIERRTRRLTPGAHDRPTTPYTAQSRAGVAVEEPTPVSAASGDEPPVLLTTPKDKRKSDSHKPVESDDAELVVLLTKPKRKK